MPAPHSDAAVESRVYLRVIEHAGDRSWEVYLLEGDNPRAERIGHERFEHEKVARLYAAELLRLFRAERVVEV